MLIKNKETNYQTICFLDSKFKCKDTCWSNIYKLQMHLMNTGMYMYIYVKFSGTEREIGELARHWRPQWRDHRPSHLPVHTTGLIPPGGSTNV